MSSARGRQRIYFDGGCRPNPGRIETAVVVNGVVRVDADAGHGDHHDAEWLALIAAATVGREMAAIDVEFVGDSAYVVGQASGAAKGRSRHFATYHDAIAGFARVRVKRVPRARNLAGIALAARHPR